MGGENTYQNINDAATDGSSPRGRGKRETAEDWFEKSRLIPAWAGKTERVRVVEDRYWAHPRVGGENIKAAVSVVVEWGSSPRGRGKLENDAHSPGL